MAQNLTFTMIKPSSVRNNDIGAILKMINDNGFRIKAMKLTSMTRVNAEAFYGIHAGKPQLLQRLRIHKRLPSIARE